MNIEIRHETQEEYRIVDEITRDAFWNLYVPGCDEHYLAHALRTHEDYLPELSFVIAVDGEIAGSIFYSRSKICKEDGGELEILTFGPVCIAKKFQGKGLGRKLITHSIEAARAAGHSAIIIGGDWRHYSHYGFCSTKKYGISMPDEKFYTGILALPLQPNVLSNAKGIWQLSPVFEIDGGKAAEFDKTFTPKEKVWQESQDWFATASTEIDERIY